MKLNLNKKNKKGFTLIEILLVVGFIALASVGVYTIYNKVQISNQANVESRSIDLIRAGIKSLYGSKTVFTGLNNTVVNQGRITPESMRDPANLGNIVNVFGGTVDVGPTTLGTGGTANNAFFIHYTAVPAAVCIKLASAAGAQFDQVSIGGATPGAGVIIKTYGVNDIDVVNITAECNKDTGSGVQLAFGSI